jgi:hypothetical protein
MVCVAMLLGGLSGCTLNATNLNLFAASTDSEQIVAGSLESVSTSAEDSLRQMGVFVNKSRDGESVRLRSSTKDGKQFNLVFTNVKRPNGDRTRIRIEWDSQADTNFWLQLVEVVATAQMDRDGKAQN